MQTESINNPPFFFFLKTTDNNIGDTGAVIISNALKTNTTLTELCLASEDQEITHK